MVAEQGVEIPPAYTMEWPTVQAVRNLGGSATIQEIADEVVRLMGLTEEQQAVPHGDGSRSEIEYRLAWARTTLRLTGLAERSARGVWALTELGREVSEEEAWKLRRKWESEKYGARAHESDGGARPEGETSIEAETSWKDRLIGILLAMDPSGFERLFMRVLREAGFEHVEVTGRSGDGGIDGTGIYRLSLMSFPVPFQCKRWKASVGPKEIRDFRGGMIGRAEHALFVTTASFTTGAKDEAKRPGTAPIDLIDGDRLTDLLKEFFSRCCFDPANGRGRRDQ